MDFDCLEIRIIDTTENDRELVIENTQIESPTLIYNGQDDKFGNLMTSELHFNMLVSDNADAKFIHLFTGDEKHYRVELVDVTDVNNEQLVWVGFLLPEQFSEPYESGAIFVEFVATDGIGLLKDKDFVVRINEKRSVVSALFDCLNLTGLELPLWLAPAIQNSAFELNYDDLMVDASSYNDEDKFTDAYKVLNYLLESIGCRLFQYQAKWFVVGLNRFNEPTIDFFKYTKEPYLLSEVVFEGKEDFTRFVYNKKWFTAPVIQAVPKLKEALIKWDWDNSKFLFPEKLVTAFPDGYQIGDNVGSEEFLKYLKLVKDDNRVKAGPLILVRDPNFDYSSLNFNSFIGNVFPVQANLTQIVGGPITQIISPVNTGTYAGFQNSFITVADLDNNYLELKEWLYVYGSEDADRSCTIDVLLEVPILNSSNSSVLSQVETAIENKEFVPLFNFALYRKDHITQEESVKYFSLFDEGVPEDFLELDFRVSKGVLVVELKIENLAIREDGFYSVRLYPVVNHTLLSAVVWYKKVHVKLKTPKTRDCKSEVDSNFSTSFSLDVFHSSSRMVLSKRRFLFSDRLQQLLESGNLISTGNPIVTRYFTLNEVYNGNALFYTNVCVGLYENDYRKLVDGYTLYKRKVNTTNLIEVSTDDYSLQQGQVGWEIVQVQFAINPGLVDLIEETDELFVIYSSASGVIDYANYWLDKWVRVNNVESSSCQFCKALGLMYLELLHRSFFKVMGVVSYLYSPMDIIRFNYAGSRNFFPTNLTLNLTEGTTEVTVLEERDLEQVSIIATNPNPPNNTPSIEITSQAIAPHLDVASNGSFVWVINTQYQINNISTINAEIKAVHLSDSVANGGTPTGFEMVGNLTNTSGNHLFPFPFEIPDNQKGWYEVTVSQSGVVSNKEHVQISPTRSAEISITKSVLDNAQRKVKIEVNKTFDPVQLKLAYQKLETFSEEPLSQVQYEDVSYVNNLEYTFPEAGKYLFWLEDSKIQSNKLTFLFL